jgi:hypothetical protein
MSAAAVCASFPDSARTTTASDSDAKFANKGSAAAAAAAVPRDDEEAHAARLRREALRSRDNQVLFAIGKIEDKIKK